MKTKMKRKTLEQRVLDAVTKGDASAFYERGPSFNTSDKDYLLIATIAKRAVLLAAENGLDYDCTSASMDITACHANGCPLDLEKLIKADDFNFAHDVFGIRRHIDRETGKLMDFFLPRSYQGKPTRRAA